MEENDKNNSQSGYKVILIKNFIYFSMTIFLNNF